MKSEIVFSSKVFKQKMLPHNFPNVFSQLLFKEFSHLSQSSLGLIRICESLPQVLPGRFQSQGGVCKAKLPQRWLYLFKPQIPSRGPWEIWEIRVITLVAKHTPIQCGQGPLLWKEKSRIQRLVEKSKVDLISINLVDVHCGWLREQLWIRFVLLHNKLPQIQQLKTTHIYHLTVLQARSPGMAQLGSLLSVPHSRCGWTEFSSRDQGSIILGESDLIK